MTLVLPIGQILRNVPFDVYKNFDAINAHGLIDMSRSAANYLHKKNNPQPPTQAMLFGSLLHTAVLEPHEFLKNVVVKDPNINRRTIAGRQTYAQLENSLNPNNILIDKKTSDLILAMSEKIFAHPIAKKYLSGGIAESTVLFKDHDTQELCKCRPDYITSQKIIVDLKTTQDVSPTSFAKDAFNLMYPLQAAHYLHCAKVTGIADATTFVFVAVGKDAPHEICVFEASKEFLEFGEVQRKKLMLQFQHCKFFGQWPGDQQDLLTLGLPKWAKQEEMPY